MLNYQKYWIDALGFKNVPLFHKKSYEDTFFNNEIYYDIFLDIVNIISDDIKNKDIEKYNTNELKFYKIDDYLLVYIKLRAPHEINNGNGCGLAIKYM